MSFYGSRVLKGKFSVHKHELNANQQYRYGGVEGVHIYDTITFENILATTDGTVPPVTIINAGANPAAAILLNRVLPNTSVTFSNITFVNVESTHLLDSNTHAVLVEGSAVINGENLDANTDVNIIEPSAAITGECKLVTFTFTMQE